MLKFRISVSFLLSVLALQTLLCSSLAWNNLRLLEASHYELWQHFAKEQSTSLAPVSVPKLAPSTISYANPVLTDFLAKAKAQNLTIVLVGLFVSGLVVIFIGLPLDRKLARLAININALRQGDLIHPMPVSTFDATADAAKAINGLAHDLKTNRTELSSQYEQLLQEFRRLNTLLQGIKAIVWEVDPTTGSFRYVSAEAESLLGYPTREWLAPDFCKRHIHPNDLDWVQGFLTHPTAANSLTLDFRIFNSEDDCLWLRMICSMEVREDSHLLVGLLLNVTEEKLSEQRIAYLADHDPLTNLINRRRFQEKLEEQIAYNRRYNVSGALLFMDLDQFKYINDTYGHHTGDEYLRQVAYHLRKSLRETDIIGRLGGDEFAVLLPNTTNEQAIMVSNALLRTLNATEFFYEGHRTLFSASIGIVFFPKQGEKASELLAKADSAMYAAKDHGRNTYCIYEEGSGTARMQEKIHWEERIRRALRENRFQLYFQPIVNIHTGAICHYEALLRMIGADGKIIKPATFIGIAERFGLIRDIDCWVVANAIRIQGDSIRMGKPVTLTINLSGRHFGSRKILEIIQETTQRYDADPNSIIFEVTETVAVENLTAAYKFIQALRDMRYRFALDDFGAGFSSFDYLKHVPVDFVKIDGGFVRNLFKSKVDQIVVKAIVEMARGLGVQPIAEFVENQETVEILKKLGVPMGQGYFFAKPAPHFQNQDQLAFGISTIE